MVALRGVMVDCSTQVLEVASRAALLAAQLHVFAALFSVHLGQHLCAPPIIETPNALLEFSNAWNSVFVLLGDGKPFAQSRQFRVQINREYIGDRNCLNILNLTPRRVLGGDVVLQALLGGRNLICSAACADIATVVADDPGGSMCDVSGFVPPFAFEVESGALASTRHSCRIRSMLAIVVNSLLAIFS